jgi:hypothetical protein
MGICKAARLHSFTAAALTPFVQRLLSLEAVTSSNDLTAMPHIMINSKAYQLL